jgi:hypothetical protein
MAEVMTGVFDADGHGHHDPCKAVLGSEFIEAKIKDNSSNLAVWSSPPLSSTETSIGEAKEEEDEAEEEEGKRGENKHIADLAVKHLLMLSSCLHPARVAHPVTQPKEGGNEEERLPP